MRSSKNRKEQLIARFRGISLLPLRLQPSLTLLPIRLRRFWFSWDTGLAWLSDIVRVTPSMPLRLASSASCSERIFSLCSSLRLREGRGLRFTPRHPTERRPQLLPRLGRFFDGFGADTAGLGGSNSSGEKICDSQLSMIAAGRTELSFLSLKNTEYIGRPAFASDLLRKQTNQGADETGLAAIGPATSSGATSFSCSAAFRRSTAEDAMTGAGSSFGSGPSSANAEQTVRTRQGKVFSHRIEFGPLGAPPFPTVVDVGEGLRCNLIYS